MKKGLLPVIYALLIAVTSCDSGAKEISYNNPNDPDGAAYNGENRYFFEKIIFDNIHC